MYVVAPDDGPAAGVARRGRPGPGLMSAPPRLIVSLSQKLVTVPSSESPTPLYLLHIIVSLYGIVWQFICMPSYLSGIARGRSGAGRREEAQNIRS